MIEKGGAVNPTKAHPWGYMDFSLGKSGIWLNGHISLKTNSVAVMVTVGTDQSLALFKLLEKDRAEYEANFGEPLKWVEVHQGSKS